MDWTRIAYVGKRLGLITTMLVLAACDWGSSQSSQQDQVNSKVTGRHGYIPKNDVEFNNYNQRQKIADDPTTILFYNLQTYCTTEPSIWQKQKTTIVTQTDSGLLAAQQKAQDLLRQGKTAEAQQVLAAAAGGQ